VNSQERQVRGLAEERRRERDHLQTPGAIGYLEYAFAKFAKVESPSWQAGPEL
jgi:hypothetical protein